MIRAAASAILLLSLGLTYAKTPSQLKADFAGILPAGKKARAVWAQGSIASYGSNDAHIYGVDSDDGVVRKITSGTLNADWPCLSADGSRIFFIDHRSYEVKIINWQGDGLRTLQADYATSGEVSMESWVDPQTRSDWVIVGDACGGRVGRINVDNPGQCVKLWTCGSPCPSFGDGIALSLDGTHLGAMWEVNGNFASGVGNVATGTVKRHTTWIGCGVSMPADNSYRVSFANQDIRVSTGVLPYQSIPAVSALTTWVQSKGLRLNCPAGDWFEMSTHRWTSHPDYLSVTLYSSAANPFIYNVSSDKHIALQDNLTCNWTGHPDVLIYASSSTRQRTVRGSVDVTRRADEPGTPYRIDGRRLDASAQRGSAGLIVRPGRVDGRLQLRVGNSD